jgi:hypothetical protein
MDTNLVSHITGKTYVIVSEVGAEENIWIRALEVRRG